MAGSRILLVGLGNPGPQYAATRHNVGFMILDRLAHACGLRFVPSRGKPAHEAASGVFHDHPVTLLKPLTFMNRSGEAVGSVLRFYKISVKDLLVIHDDLDLPFGRMKFVRNGGAGGHNGIRSIIEMLGTRDFCRCKIGIGRPPAPVPADRYVLSAFSPSEVADLDALVEAAVSGVAQFLDGGLEAAMNTFNGLDITASPRR